MRRVVCLTVAGAAALALACGSSTEPPQQAGPTSGVDAGDPDAGYDRFLTDLTLNERKQLCDWSALELGGYGQQTVCDGGLVVTNFADQSACLGSFLGGCNTVSVTEWEACMKKQATDVCALFLYSSEECAEVARCVGQTDGGPAPEPEAGGD